MFFVQYLSQFDICKIIRSGGSEGVVIKIFLFIQTENSFHIVTNGILVVRQQITRVLIQKERTYNTIYSNLHFTTLIAFL